VFANAAKRCAFHKHTTPVQVTARNIVAQVVPHREHPGLNSTNQGVVTWKFSVGYVTNSWQQCICPRLTEGKKTECLNSTNQGVSFKVTVYEKMLARVLKEIAHYRY
jgi:hypothetical protein